MFGWDRRCVRDEQWVAEAGVDPGQPFYYVLPDERDCMRLFNQRELLGVVVCGVYGGGRGGYMFSVHGGSRESSVLQQVGEWFFCVVTRVK